ncbi:MAG: hypothetical protein IJ086_05730 [Clostridium sp.]|nr:hypothetical protein [Clostridium sp.]
MINIINYKDTKKSETATSKSLNELFTTCLNEAPNSEDKDYYNWINHYLNNPDEINNLPIAKKLSFIRDMNYEILDGTYSIYMENNICQICGNNNDKTYLTFVDNKKFSTCINCL